MSLGRMGEGQVGERERKMSMSSSTSFCITDAPHPANGSIAQNGAGGGGGGDSGSGSETHASEADLLRHLQLQRELNRHSAADLRSAMAYARAHNCTASQDGSTTPTSSCYYRYTTLLLRLLQRNFYDSVSP